MKRLALALAALVITMNARAEIKTETVEYTQDGATYEGFLAYDNAVQGKRPGVLIAHQWKGLGANEKKRAEMLAQLGYVAFALDIYGKGIRPQSPAEAGQLAGRYKGDRPLLRRRAIAGLEVLEKQPFCDTSKLAVIGYCFGGTTALELARSGAPVKAAVSFHGGLSSPTPADAANIKGKVLVLHGADDPNVPPPEVAGFEKEMRDARVDWQLIAYGGAVHSFTDWNAGNDNSKGAAYNEKADRRSWEAMKQLFAETLR
ncbi:MAG TPA: dienelactone hydrolase family protein [Verrucomicrobiae bacterium]|nr:dienelactone hydrolase family protein [Verrucomicrobiae bacterium]